MVERDVGASLGRQEEIKSSIRVDKGTS